MNESIQEYVDKLERVEGGDRILMTPSALLSFARFVEYQTLWGVQKHLNNEMQECTKELGK